MSDYICPKCKTKMLKDTRNGAKIGCPKCRISEEGNTLDEAYRNYCKKTGLPPMEPIEAASLPAEQSSAPTVPTVPTKANFVEYAKQSINDYTMGVKSFMTQSAVEKLLVNNAKYITNEPMFNKLWNTEEGIQSLMDAFNESISLAAELPTLGYIIPYGTTATFIPRVEAFQNVLTNGANAPFEWLNIEAIHSKDKVRISRKNGAFSIEFENIGFFDRGEVVGVAVYGLHKASKMVIGECYEANRLFEKGTATSSSYRQYKMDLDYFMRKESEGKTKEKDGRVYVEKSVPKRDGGSWIKELYREDIVNPYENAHREEMLKKVAGKTFLSPYIKQRIGSVIVEEMQNIQAETQETVVERSVSMAETQFDDNAIVRTDKVPNTEQFIEEDSDYTEAEDLDCENHSEDLF